MSFRFLHLADLHLETCYGGRDSTRQRLREATAEAFRAAVALAVERRLDAVLVAGDSFDDPLLSRRGERLFLGGLRDLVEEGIEVVIACGNHDPGGRGKRMAHLGLGEADDWRGRVHLLRTARPKVITIRGQDGEPLGAVAGAGHANDREEKNLLSAFHPLDKDLPVVGLLHTQVHAARGATSHAAYAPCTREDLLRLDYDYYALGHVHLRQQPFEDVPAWYCGNLQGRNPRELGDKGGLVVELEARAAVTPEFVPLAPVVWERSEVADLASCHTRQELAEHLLAAVRRSVAERSGREVILRLELSGPCPAAPSLRIEEEREAFEEELAEEGGALEVELRATGLYRPRDLEALRSTPSVIREALELIEGAHADPALLSQLRPKELASAEHEDETAYLAGLLEGLTEELLSRSLEDPA